MSVSRLRKWNQNKIFKASCNVRAGRENRSTILEKTCAGQVATRGWYTQEFNTGESDANGHNK